APTSTLYPYTTLFRSEKPETGTMPDLRAQPHATAKVRHDLSADRQAEPGSAGAVMLVPFHLPELLEHHALLVVRNARPVVLHLQDRKSTRLNSSHVKT